MGLFDTPLPRRLRNTLSRRMVMRSGLFDPRWYCARYPDVAASNIDPLSHYLRCGGHEGRSPSAAFDGARYLAENPDVAQAGCNPLLHYLRAGRTEGRLCHPVAVEYSSHAEVAVGATAFCTVVDANHPKKALAFALVASWHRHCRAWSSLHVVLVGEDQAFSDFARRLGAEVVARDPHPLAERLAFANKWLVADLDIGTARPILLDWDFVFLGDPWLLRALPPSRFGARLAPALRVPQALQRWVMEQFQLPRALNVAVFEVADQSAAARDRTVAEVTREFRYYNGGLLALPPRRLRDVVQAWQAAYECLVHRIDASPDARDLPRIEDSALRSDQLALAIALSREDVHPIDPSSAFFLFDSKFGYASDEVAMLHLAGPVTGEGLRAVVETFEAQWAGWHIAVSECPRFDPGALRGKLETLVSQYGPDGAVWTADQAASTLLDFAAPQEDSAYDDPALVDAIVREGKHRDLVGGLWSEIGRLQFNYLKDHGLRPDDHLLDIGCGSLRGGVHFAAYLQPGHYWGIDANVALLKAGRTELELAGLSDRVPDGNLLEDSEFDFERFGHTFDVALAQSLFTHLPLNRIRLCLFRLAKVMPPKARLFATYLEVPEQHPVDAPFRHTGDVVSHGHKDPFHYRPSAIAEFIAMSPWRLVAVRDWGHPRDQRMIVLERSSIDATVARTMSPMGVSSDISA